MFKQPKRKLLSLFLMAGTLLGAFCMGKQLVNILEAGRQQIAEAGEAAIRAARRVKEASAQWIETASASQINFLVVGMDDAWSGSDVIMLASLNADEGSLRIVQIPRDTYINRENSQNHKLNSVFANAIAAAHQSGQQGAEAIHTASRSLVSFLETNLGVPIDHYVTLRTGGLRAIVDAVGGVTLTIPRDIDYDDNYGAIGKIIQIIYKGDHYQLIVRTEENEEDFVFDTEDTWNENDIVRVVIPKEEIKLKLKQEMKR